MARRGIKKKDYENLDDAHISKVISLLESESPITKKEACEILNISYNTSRLSKIIEQYKDKKAYEDKRRKANRRKPLLEYEIKEIILQYLKGVSIKAIADSLYRPVTAVKKTISDLHLPDRTGGSSDYFNPSYIPDEAVSFNFDLKEYVWSARYNCIARIEKCLGEDNKHNDLIYKIWVYGKHNEFAYQPAHELGKLEALKTFNLREDEFHTAEKPNFAYRIE